MDIVICSGCGEDVPHDNKECPLYGWNGAEGRLMTLSELLAAPSHPERGARGDEIQVCPAFLRRLAEEATKAHNASDKLRMLCRVIDSIEAIEGVDELGQLSIGRDLTAQLLTARDEAIKSLTMPHVISMPTRSKL
jgi:hypothetical protein